VTRFSSFYKNGGFGEIPKPTVKSGWEKEEERRKIA
jgi:hypothetical protein